MKLVSATITAVRIPFVEAFSHSAMGRSWSDSVIVQVTSDSGAEGFGEGAPRPYVTGETVELMLSHLAHDLWPAIAGRELPDIEGDLGVVDRFIPERPVEGLIADNASRAALELAVLDCALRVQGRGVGSVLAPKRQSVRYSGVVTGGSVEQATQLGRQMKLIGFDAVKIKVGQEDDVDRVGAVRHVLGPDVSLRLDANGAWNTHEAADALDALAPYDIACVEQPIPRGDPAELRRFREASPIPIMVDESLTTLADAEALIAQDAADYFNVRISKCGGLARSLEIAERARAAGVAVQVGSQVGETAILSAAGRHLAATLEEVAFTEGSYGTLLLSEDVSADPVRFGHGGQAPLLGGPGLGIRILDEKVRKYAVEAVVPGCS